MAALDIHCVLICFHGICIHQYNPLALRHRYHTSTSEMFPPVGCPTSQAFRSACVTALAWVAVTCHASEVAEERPCSSLFTIK